ncbi:MAG: hypothetical protein F6K09_19575 [Merismopedia sp. SIO2A8]|nr:hypothetical protein [Merismopedia sp. SIO2A8]
MGNAHVMESERLIESEAQLRNGIFNVREFVRAVALSDLYKSRFFDGSSNNRFIELNFKHLLGRAPTGYDDFAYHGRLITEQGYAAEISSYIDSEEYFATFGNDIVPYYQGYSSPTGQKLIGFTYMFALLRGSASSDQESKGIARLDQTAFTAQANEIVPPSTPDFAWSPQRRGGLVVADVQRIVNKALNIPEQAVDVKGMVKEAPQPSADETVVDLDRYQQYQGYKAFDNTPIFELIPGQWESEDDFQAVVRAVYRQVLGNAHVMESERLVKSESQLRSGEISVREFVRQVAKSELYQSRFFTPCYRYRAIELNFKHLLGRAPDSYQEMIPHSDILDHEGYEADIDSYLDSDEYQNAFGENIVPYYRYKTRNGQSMLGFTNTFGLLASASSSDKDPKTNNAPRVMTALMLNNPYGAPKPTDARSLAEEAVKQTSPALSVITTKSYSVEERQELSVKVQEQEDIIARLETRLSEMQTMAGLGAIALNRPFTEDVAVNTSSTAAIIAMFDSKNDVDELKEKVSTQAEQIKQLERKIMEARSLSSVAEYKLNKWQQRSY